mgnify:CR=1 FL=1
MTIERTRTIYDMLDSAKEELAERIRDYPDEDPVDMIHEIADGSVPVYFHELIMVCEAARGDEWSSLWLEPSEFDGSPTPVNILAGNLYNLVSNALHEYLQAKEDE